MLVVPWGWDQPDNAARVARRSVGLSIEKESYSIDSAASALRRLAGDEGFRTNAAAAAAQIRTEDGLRAAVEAIETMLGPQEAADLATAGPQSARRK